MNGIIDKLIDIVGINAVPWVFSGMFLALGAFWGWTFNGWRWEAELATVQAAWDKERAALAQAAAAASEAARGEERRAAEALAAAAADHLKGIEDAKDKERRVVAGLRANVVRMRRQWAGCEHRMPQAAASASEPDDAAELRIESAARIVRAAAQCDAHVSGLQSALRGERQQESSNE
jgi:hypothetical protein